MHVLQSVWKDAVNDTEPRETIFNRVNINSASVGWQVFAYLFFLRTAFKIRIFFSSLVQSSSSFYVSRSCSIIGTRTTGVGISSWPACIMALVSELS